MSHEISLAYVAVLRVTSPSMHGTAGGAGGVGGEGGN